MKDRIQSLNNFAVNRCIGFSTSVLEGREKDIDPFEILKINKNTLQLYVTKLINSNKIYFFKEKSLKVLVALFVNRSILPKWQMNFCRIWILILSLLRWNSMTSDGTLLKDAYGLMSNSYVNDFDRVNRFQHNNIQLYRWVVQNGHKTIGF